MLKLLADITTDTLCEIICVGLFKPCNNTISEQDR